VNTNDLVVLATGFSGLLEGASADRYIVQVPAWRHMDVMTWAEQSRHADLGNGRFWYPVLAFAATGLFIAAAIGVHAHPPPSHTAAVAVYLATASEAIGLAFTILAAPNLIYLRKPRDRPTTEARFRLFHRWGIPRAILQIAGFPLGLWALWLLT